MKAKAAQRDWRSTVRNLLVAVLITYILYGLFISWVAYREYTQTNPSYNGSITASLCYGIQSNLANNDAGSPRCAELEYDLYYTWPQWLRRNTAPTDVNMYIPLDIVVVVAGLGFWAYRRYHKSDKKQKVTTTKK